MHAPLFNFRSLQCERLSIHINVVIALIFFYIINIIYAEPILSGGINKRRPDTHLDTVILFFTFLPTYQPTYFLILIYF